jgi:hypothetical protein
VKHDILAVECDFFIQTAKIGQFFWVFEPKNPIFLTFWPFQGAFYSFSPSKHFGRPENVYSEMGCATVASAGSG